MGILGPNSPIHIERIFYDEINNAVEFFFFFSPLTVKEIQMFNSDMGADFHV